MHINQPQPKGNKVQEYEVEVIGHYSQTITIQAETEEEAEILAVSEFERDFVPYSNDNGWSDAWSWTDTEGVTLIGEEEEY